MPPSPWNPIIDLPRMDAQSDAAQVVEQLHAAATELRVVGSETSGGTMCCRFVNEGCLAVGPSGEISPCLPLMHTYTYYFRGEKRRVRAHLLGNVNETTIHDVWRRADYRAFRDRVAKFAFSPCIDCGGCDLRESNEKDCFGNEFPCCGECLWAAGIVQCP